MALTLTADKQERARQRARAWYAANRARALANVRAYAAKNKAKIAADHRAYRAEHKAALKISARANYARNRLEKIAYQKALHASKPEVIKAYKKTWWKKHAAKRAVERKADGPRLHAQYMRWYHSGGYERHREAFLARNAKRRVMQRGAITEPVDFGEILRKSEGLCGICRKPFDLFGIDFDHIVPLTKGGAHTAANLQATHARCNRSKGARVS